MGNYKNKWLSLLVGLSLLSGAAISSEVVLEPVKALPVDKELLTVTGDPVSVIETGIITDENGVAARGPHEISFTLDENAPYGVVVGGETVLPGETKVLVKNLTTSDHKLTLPVYPMVPGIEGVASYSIDIPQIKVEACPSGFTETPNDCYKVTYSTIEYECPSNSEYQEDTLDCRKTEESAVVEYCDAPFVKQNGKCVQEFTVAATQTCPSGAEWTKDGTTCRYLDSQGVENCPADYALQNGECRALTVKVQSCPAGYVNDGVGGCHKDETESATENCPSGYSVDGTECVSIDIEAVESCPSGYHFTDGMCHLIVAKSPSCPSDYTLVDGSCEKVESAPFSEACADGYELTEIVNEYKCNKRKMCWHRNHANYNGLSCRFYARWCCVYCNKNRLSRLSYGIYTVRI
ncbi:hypothetical protein L3081_24230 [Colwellia sp. MSW7]|uniref:Uncharacterized protein n=1 Tax=Colwellia maritima TaxID=2912588 RepID=A0ABS9X6T5_9GAMM|nr:hypothetical protein [Colwellia maritima]MCI2285937.1 hypothetical protein [Colwellia maritima]